MLKMRLILLVLPICAGFHVLDSRAQTPGEVLIGEVLPDARMQGLNGPPRMLSEFRGRPLIINVWASWCGPCRAEMASLERLAWMDESKDLTVIGISTDDYVDNAKAALDASNATITHFIDSQLRLENMLGASRLPLTVLVDPDGRVVQKVYGARAWDGADALQLIADGFGGVEKR
jgi:thiol-disulfide isomerase/thioredoxin